MKAEFAQQIFSASDNRAAIGLSKGELAVWLSDVRLADSTLNLPQTEGFLFAVACCPVKVDHLDWLTVVLGDALMLSERDPAGKLLPEVCATLVDLFRSASADVADLSYHIPDNYPFSWDAFERRALEQWCEGMLLADEWLLSQWMLGLERVQHSDPFACIRLSDELEDTISWVRLLADVDDALEKLELRPEECMLDIRQRLKDGYDGVDKYLFRYMQAGKLLADYFVRKEPQVRAEPKVGRNNPCICGSGLKYKKCCMST